MPAEDYTPRFKSSLTRPRTILKTGPAEVALFRLSGVSPARLITFFYKTQEKFFQFENLSYLCPVETKIINIIVDERE